jgi:hypothetical protein
MSEVELSEVERRSTMLEVLAGVLIGGAVAVAIGFAALRSAGGT